MDGTANDGNIRYAGVKELRGARVDQTGFEWQERCAKPGLGIVGGFRWVAWR